MTTEISGIHRPQAVRTLHEKHAIDPGVKTAVAVAQGAALVERAATLVDTMARSADLGGAGAEAGAKVIDSGRISRLAAAGGRVSRGLATASGIAGHAAIGLAGVQAALTSEASSVSGAVVEGVAVSAGTGTLVRGLVQLGPGAAVLAVDMALNHLGEAMLGSEVQQAAGGWITGHAVTTPAKVAVAYYEAVVHGDTTTMDRFIADGREGKYGVVYQGALAAGDKLSEKLGDGIDAAVAFFNRK